MQTFFVQSLAIGIGAMIGANARYALSQWAIQQWGSQFPYGTMMINIIGSFCIGLIMALSERWNISPVMKLLLVTGLLGGFTTFSSFSFEIYTLIQQGFLWNAFIYAILSVGIGLIAVIFAVQSVHILLR
jgi:CrcB protein